MPNPRSAAVLAALLLAGTSIAPPAAQVSSRGPQLVVIVVVDQMRYDYLTRFAKFWKEGFARLLKDGAVFEDAYYPYLNTVTCPGHATISTGAFPATHGIILNEWWQRTANRRMSCTDDPTVKSLVYGAAPEPIGHSGYRLRVPSLADRLRAASPQSRVVTNAMKPRSAVMLAGHGSTATTWFADSVDTWATSTAFSAALLPEVTSHLARNPIDRDRAAVWTRTYDPKAYSGEDDGTGEKPLRGWTPVFAHPLAGSAGTAADQYYELWKCSPYADAAQEAFASSLIESFRLGQRGVVDFLGVSFSTLDCVGHNFGPDSHEVQDTLIRLDQTVGRLLNALDRMVGRDRYVLALSADHGVAPIPEATQKKGGDAGRLIGAEVRKIAEAAMVAAHGAGPHIASVEYTNLYLTEKTRGLAAKNPAMLDPLLAAVAKIDGVLRVFRSDELETKRQSADPIERAAALSHYPAESGDVTIVPKPNWIGSTSATSHGTLHPYDQHVPVIFFGKTVKSGHYSDHVTPADIAPTLASTIDLRMPGVDGRVLKQALR